ncbi:MAG TPA: ABC transporter substrate-binding protein [Nakamurella sp.]|nr:ABC transporter substrate-binding protein [Nakamurella sp.]
MAGERCPDCGRPVGRDGQCRFCAASRAATAAPRRPARSGGTGAVLGAAGLVIAVLVGLVSWRATAQPLIPGAATAAAIAVTGPPGADATAAGPAPASGIDPPGTASTGVPSTSSATEPSPPVEADKRRREYPRMLPDGGSTSVTPPTTSTPPPSTSATVSPPKAGTSLTVGVLALPRSSDPLLVTAPDAMLVLHQVFDGLTKYTPDGRSVRPALATSWSANSDFTQWRFTLAPGRQFSDGTEVTAAAVCANFIRWSTLPESERDDGFYWQVYFGDFAGAPGEADNLAGCTAPTSTQVWLAFATPVRALPAVLALPYFGIAAPASFGEDIPVGSGPYRWSSGDDSSVTLEYNPLSGQSAKVARLVFLRTSGTSKDALGALRSGAIDLYGPVDGAARPAEDAGVQVVTRPASTVLMLGMNQAAGRPLSRASLREAVADAVDTTALAKLSGPGATSTGSLLPPVVSGKSRPGTPAKPDRASSLVAGAPPAARSVVFLVRDFASATADGAYADAIANQLRGVGFTVTVRSASSAEQYYRILGSGAADLFISPFWPDTNDVDDLLSGLITSQADLLGIAHADWYPGFLDRMGTANLQESGSRRVRDLSALADELVSKYRVGVPLLLTTSSWLVRSPVTGLTPSPLRIERLTGVSAG